MDCEWRVFVVCLYVVWAMLFSFSLLEKILLLYTTDSRSSDVDIEKEPSGESPRERVVLHERPAINESVVNRSR